MNDPVQTRRYVREVLALACGHRRPELTERQIYEGVDQLSRNKLEIDELTKAVLWNIKEGYIFKRFDKDSDADVWSLTDEGKTKEGIK